MITRLFTGTLRPGARDDFARYLADVAVPVFLTSPGAASLQIHLPDAEGGEVLCATLWRDVNHVRAFAGDDWPEPAMGPGEAEMLERSSVTHHFGMPPRDGLVVPLGPPTAIGDARVRLDTRGGRVEVDGRGFVCAPRELRLLQALVTAQGDPVSPRDLALQVWPNGACMTSEDVRRAVHKLRRSIADHHRRPPLIRNRRGFGYLVDL